VPIQKRLIRPISALDKIITLKILRVFLRLIFLSALNLTKFSRFWMDTNYLLSHIVLMA
jgi:hypothetical protein